MSAAAILKELEARGFKLAIAESLTGGLLSAEFVSVPGASKVLLGSVTAYQNSIKENMLDVPAGDLEKFGAVSAEVAEAMALGVQRKFATQSEPIVGVSTTGVAGPDADGDKPVGLAYVGLAIPGLPVQNFELKLDGSRAEIRTAVVQSAVSELLEQIGN